MKQFLFSLVLILVAPLARAHPHVFVDVGLTFQVDAQGRVEAVEVSWTYDALYTLLILADRGLDTDADLKLTEEEQAGLLGFDLEDWPEDFEGAMFLRTQQQDLELGPPKPVSVQLQEGQLVSVHVRAFPPVDADGLVVAPYDPYYYAALTLASVSGLPEACAAEISRADEEEADAQVADLGDASVENFFEEARVGIYYADRVRITCGDS